MKIEERKKRLAEAERKVKETRKRIKRLMTAERNWLNRVYYHQRQLGREEVEEITKHFKQERENLRTGRMFRDE